MEKNLIDDIEINNTNRCNFSCIFCPHNYIDIPNKTMSQHDFEEIVNKISVSEPNTIDLGVFGEPLIDEEIKPKLKYLFNNIGDKTKISISTNGYFLTPDLYDEISPFLDNIGISLHSLDPRIYSYLTGTDLETLKAVKNNLKYALKSNMTQVLLAPVLTKLNPNIVKILKGTYKGTYNNCYVRPSQIFNRCGNVPPFDDICPTRTNKGICGSDILNDLIVDHNGDILLCCQDFEKKITMGNLLQSSLDSILNNEMRKEIKNKLDKEKHPNIETCKKCKVGWWKTSFPYQRWNRDVKRE